MVRRGVEQLIDILVVDDEQQMREVLRDVLEEHGYFVEEASGGWEALEKLASHSYDLVLLDLKMPDLDGIEVLKRARAQKSDICAIMMTAFASPETAVEALKNGAYDYITKPFSPEDLISTIERALREQELERQNKRLLETLQHKTERLDKKVKQLILLSELSNKISGVLDEDEIYRMLVNYAKLVFNADAAGVYLKRDGFYPHIVEKEFADEELVEGLIRAAERNQHPIISPDARFMAVPLIYREGVKGALVLLRGTPPFDEDDSDLALSLAKQICVVLENVKMYTDLQALYVGTLTALAAAIDARCPYTRRHSEEVSRYAVSLGRQIGLTIKELRRLEAACKLHDIGKIAVADSVLTKPGPLDEEEWRIIKVHPVRGAEILQASGFLSDIAEVVRHHHERYDGSGYPDSLKGDEIPFEARIVAVADAFEAMTSERYYRPALTFAQAMEQIEKFAGEQFDPELSHLFIELMRQGDGL